MQTEKPLSVIPSPPAHLITSRRHSFHQNGVKEKVLGAGLCTLSNFPHTLIDQALLLTEHGKNVISKLSPDRRRKPLLTEKKTEEPAKFVSLQDSPNHNIVTATQQEKRYSPVSSESFDASERSFNPELYAEFANRALVEHGIVDPDTDSVVERDGMVASVGIVTQSSVLEQAVVDELTKR